MRRMRRIVMCVVMVMVMAGAVWGYDRDDRDHDPNVMILNPGSGAMTPGIQIGDGAAVDVTTGRVVIPAAPAGPGVVIDLSGEDNK